MGVYRGGEEKSRPGAGRGMVLERVNSSDRPVRGANFIFRERRNLLISRPGALPSAGGYSFVVTDLITRRALVITFARGNCGIGVHRGPPPADEITQEFDM